MPKDVGYSFLPFEMETVARELAQMQGIPETPENLINISNAISQNPALGANTLTGREIAAKALDPITRSGDPRDSFVPQYFEAPGAREALEQFAALSSSQASSPETAPIDLQSQIAGEAQSGNTNRSRNLPPSSSNRRVASSRQEQQENYPGESQETPGGTEPGYMGSGEERQPISIGIEDIAPAIIGGTGGAMLGYRQVQQANQRPSYEINNRVAGEIPSPPQATTAIANAPLSGEVIRPIKPITIPESAPIDSPFSAQAQIQAPPSSEAAIPSNAQGTQRESRSNLRGAKGGTSKITGRAQSVSSAEKTTEVQRITDAAFGRGKYQAVIGPNGKIVVSGPGNKKFVAKSLEDFIASITSGEIFKTLPKYGSTVRKAATQASRAVR